MVGSVVDVQIVWLAVTRGEALSERGCGSASRGRKVCFVLDMCGRDMVYLMLWVTENGFCCICHQSPALEVFIHALWFERDMDMCDDDDDGGVQQISGHLVIMATSLRCGLTQR